MKKIKPLNPAFATIALSIFMVGLSGCTGLGSPADTASATRSTSARGVWYHQQSEQPGFKQASNQARLKTAQTNEDTSLGKDMDPGWGPVNIRW